MNNEPRSDVICTGGGRGINHGHGFRPAGRAIDDGEEVSVAF